MYRRTDRQTGNLFEELFPFGGKLKENNRWLKIAEMIPWEELEQEYEKHFSCGTGRPALEARVVLGAMLLKHLTGCSDEEISRQMEENPYFQAFCGYEHFQTQPIFEESSLSRVRKRVGVKFFTELEKKTYGVLIERKIIRGKGMLVDGSVYPQEIKYPTDSGLLNRARLWLVRQISEFGRQIGAKYRMYKRKAAKEFLGYSKKRKKTKQEIQKMKKKLLCYVRRNLKQFKEVVEKAKKQGLKVGKQLMEKVEVIRRIYEQQVQMYREKSQRIEKRIVSLHKPWVRPIVRGKEGKDVEFGPKVALSHVGKYTFLDHLSHENFNEAAQLGNQIKLFEERFGKLPQWCVGDNLYGNRENREKLQELKIRDACVPLGRKKKTIKADAAKRWRRKMHRRRNRIEGSIGHSKEHIMKQRIRYRSEEGAEMWLRLGILSMNLTTAVKSV